MTWSLFTDNTVKVWDIRVNKLLQHYTAHNAPVNDVAFHSSGNFLISASDDNTIKVFDLLEGRLFYTLHGHQGSVTATDFSRNGEYFATGGADEKCLVWKTNFDKTDYSAVLKAHKVSSEPRSARLSTCPEPRSSPVKVNAHSQVRSMTDDNPGVVEVGPSLFSRPKPSASSQRFAGAGDYCESSPRVQSASRLVNGVPNQPSLSDLELTSADRARRGETGTPDLSPPLKQPTEPQNIPYQLTATLEHIVGQLDIITQTVSILEQRLTMTEDKLRECLDNQQSIRLQVKPA
ncbi:POC1A [Bugula neritina]|uniref:POC1A n=1 Tax=Bugula neritina TaxID=10212 RepID=A0A7J7IVC9_BUGNE|nr:POC1A [Bugula neritina]